MFNLFKFLYEEKKNLEYVYGLRYYVIKEKSTQSYKKHTNVVHLVSQLYNYLYDFYKTLIILWH